MSDSEFDETEAPGLESVDVVTKYKQAAEMANKAMAAVRAKAVAGASVIELCKAGDALIEEETSKVYNKKVEGKPVPKGVAFPTCVSVNNCVCHFSPLSSDTDVQLVDGDLVKIDLGVHIDGYIAVVATSLVIGATPEKPVTGRKADVIMAANQAMEACIRMIKPGAKTDEITKVIGKIAEDFKCVPVQDMLSHQVARNVINGEKAVIQNPSEEARKNHRESEFEVNEVYEVDIIMSTGEGKARLGETRTTVYRKTDTMYQLKMKASRQFLSEVIKRSGEMPFTLRSFDDEKRARIAVKECVEHQVLEPFAVLYERDGEFVAQFRALVLLMPNGNICITNGGFDASTVKSEHDVTDEDIKKVLATSISSKSKKKKNKKKKQAADEASSAAAADN